jgi:uncharacterized Tic20 family protein
MGKEREEFSAGQETPSSAYETRSQMSEKDERLWGMFCHLAAFAGYIGVPFGNIIGPLIVWLIKRKESAFVDDQGKESLNFQITMFIVALALMVLPLCGIFSITLLTQSHAFPGPFLFCMAFPLLFGLGIFIIVEVIMASVAANGGQRFRYHLSIRFIK